MGKYHGVDCPICHEPIEDGRMIAICPDCGAPYHKECVEKTGVCLYEDTLHAEHKSWHPPRDPRFEPDDHRRCSRCGTQNPIGTLFCVVCGTPLNRPETEEGAGGDRSSQTPEMAQRPLFQMPYDPQNTPFGGVHPDEEIDGIAARDWAIFVGANTPYFLPKFRKMAQKGSRMTFNFSAFFFGAYYFLFRKMYLWGVLLLILQTLLQLPASFVHVNAVLQENMQMVMPMFATEQMIALARVGNWLTLILQFIIGFFANRWYMLHAKGKINALKEKKLPDDEYRFLLMKKGSIAKYLTIMMVFLYFSTLFLGTLFGV